MHLKVKPETTSKTPYNPFRRPALEKTVGLFRNRSASLLAAISLPVALSYGHGSDWTGAEDNRYFDVVGNWSNGVPDYSSGENTAQFNQSAAVELRLSARVSELQISSPTSFLLNGFAFQADSTQIDNNAALIIPGGAQGGIVGLGGLSLNGSLMASGDLTFVSTGNITSLGGSEISFSNGAFLQAGFISLGGSASISFQSGAKGSANSLDLGQGSVLSITGSGSRFSANNLSSAGDVLLREGALLNLGSHYHSSIRNLSAIGEGTQVTTSSLGVRNGSITGGAKLNVEFLSLQDATSSLVIAGEGSSVTVDSLSSSSGSKRQDNVAISDGGILTVATWSNLNDVSLTGNGSKLIASGSLEIRSVSVSHEAELTAHSLFAGWSGAVTISSGGLINLTAESSNHLNLGSLVINGSGSRLTAASTSVHTSSLSVTNGGQLNASALAVNELTVSGENSQVIIDTLSGYDGGENVVRVADRALLSFNDSSGSGYSNYSLKALSVDRASLSSQHGRISVSGTLSLNNADFSVNELSLSGAGAIHGSNVQITYSFENSGSLEIRDSVISTNENDGYINNNGILSGSFSTNHRLENGSSGTVKIGANDEMSFRSGNNNGYIRSANSLEFTSQFSNSNDGTVVLSGNFRANGGVENHGAFEIAGDTNIWGGDFINGAYWAASASVAVFNQSTANFMDDVTNDGTIAVADGSTVVFHGSYSGDGTITGNGTSVLLGDLRPGHSPGSQTFEGDVIFGELFTYHVEIGGLNQGIDYDTIDVGGLLTLGGTLSVSLLGDFNLQAGDTFEVLQFETIEGEFAGFEGLVMGDNSAFELVWGEHNLTLVAIPEPSTMLLLPSALFLLFALHRSGVKGREESAATRPVATANSRRRADMLPRSGV